MERVLIGIDDTDNKESRGTGFRSRQLGHLIDNKKVGIVDGITRHQLFFDPRIPYTSQNSSACLEVLTNDIIALTDLAREFLIEDSADGSDVGLAVARYDYIPDIVINWGERAKREILTQDEANKMAASNNIVLEGLTGTKDGIIGSLAAVGLRRKGEDGRFISLKGFDIRELKGIYLASEIIEKVGVDDIVEKNGNPIPKDAKIEVGNWVRPVLKKKKRYIIAVKSLTSENYEFEVATKDYIKSISD